MEEEPQMDSKELLALVASKLGTGPSNLPINFSKPINSLLDAAEVTKGIGPRPTISVPVPGTPWSVVYTNDEKMFFFDATSRKSFWDLPPELENNPQVYKIIENPPWKKSTYREKGREREEGERGGGRERGRERERERGGRAREREEGELERERGGRESCVCCVSLLLVLFTYFVVYCIERVGAVEEPASKRIK